MFDITFCFDYDHAEYEIMFPCIAGNNENDAIMNALFLLRKLNPNIVVGNVITKQRDSI